MARRASLDHVMTQSIHPALQVITDGAVTRQVLGRLTLRTRGPGFTDITRAIAEFIRSVAIEAGQATIFCRHTSASLTIQENADPDVLVDLAEAFDALAPRKRPYRHSIEGPDDMPAHIRSALTDASLVVPIAGGNLLLGRWQGIYLFEHRDRPHERDILVQILGT